MAFNERSLDDYIDVPTRIAEFREKYPDASLQPVDTRKPYKLETIQVTVVDENQGPILVERTFIVYGAAAYRTPDDKRPGIGYAWEPVPGQTPYTRNSELMNAETSAWGRAILAALAADAKVGIATRNEVAARRAEREAQPLAQAPQTGGGPPGSTPVAASSGVPAGNPGPSTAAQALADTAKRVRSLNTLRNVHTEATRKSLLGAEVANPTTGELVTLGAYLLLRKSDFDNEPQEAAG